MESGIGSSRKAHQASAVQKNPLRAATAVLANIVELAVAEARLAAVSAFAMCFLVIVAAAATIIGWALVVVVGISLLADAGISWRLTAVIIAVLHGLGAYLCWEVSARLSRNLTLPALRRAALTGRHKAQGA
jgi:hypothetical protein